MTEALKVRKEIWAELQRLRVALRLATLDDVLLHLLTTHRKPPAVPLRGPDPLRALVGLGKEAWTGVDPDHYVRQLRQGW